MNIFPVWCPFDYTCWFLTLHIHNWCKPIKICNSNTTPPPPLPWKEIPCCHCFYEFAALSFFQCLFGVELVTGAGCPSQRLAMCCHNMKWSFVMAWLDGSLNFFVEHPTWQDSVAINVYICCRRLSSFFFRLVGWVGAFFDLCMKWQCCFYPLLELLLSVW